MHSTGKDHCILGDGLENTADGLGWAPLSRATRIPERKSTHAGVLIEDYYSSILLFSIYHSDDKEIFL